MAMPVSSSNPLESSQSISLGVTKSSDERVSIATIQAFAATTQNSTSLKERVTVDFDDQSRLQIGLSAHLSGVRLSQKKCLKVPDNSPDITMDQGDPLPPIALPPSAKPQ